MRVTKQALVIGLGQFGMALARSLTERGVGVLAVDRNPELVQVASQFVAEAVAFDACDEAALTRVAPARRDISVVAIGNEARDASIVCTALLKQLGAETVYARASDPIHARILKAVGASQVVNPEQEFGEGLASRLAYARLVQQVQLEHGLVVTEFRPTEKLIGRSLADSGVQRRFGVTVVAVLRSDEAGVRKVRTIDPKQPIDADDTLVAVAPADAMQKMMDWL